MSLDHGHCLVRCFSSFQPRHSPLSSYSDADVATGSDSDWDSNDYTPQQPTTTKALKFDVVRSFPIEEILRIQTSSMVVDSVSRRVKSLGINRECAHEADTCWLLLISLEIYCPCLGLCFQSYLRALTMLPTVVGETLPTGRTSETPPRLPCLTRLYANAQSPTLLKMCMVSRLET